MPKFANLETIVLLHWFIGDFDSKFMRYRFYGDNLLISRTIQAVAEGRMVLAKMKKPIMEITKKFGLDISIESNSTRAYMPDGPWANINYLSLGIEVEEFHDAYAAQFAFEVLSEKMAIVIPPPKFKLFYLPSLPIAAIQDDDLTSHYVMTALMGFASIRNQRVEVNICQFLDYESIFHTMVHEILHICFLATSDINLPGVVESKIEQKSKEFFNKCKDDYQSQRNKIHKSLESMVEEKLYVFQKANDAFNNFREDFRQAESIINACKIFFDAILDEKVKPVLI